MTDVVIEGQRELDRAFATIDRGLQKELRKGLKEAARIVSVEAVSIARRNGLVRTGRLLRGIRPGATSREVYIRSKALNAGFNYAPVYEYGQGGRRAYLKPALDRKQDEAVDEIERVLDDLADKAGF